MELLGIKGKHMQYASRGKELARSCVWESGADSSTDQPTMGVWEVHANASHHEQKIEDDNWIAVWCRWLNKAIAALVTRIDVDIRESICL